MTTRVAVTGARGRLAPRIIEAVRRTGAEVVPFSRKADATHRGLNTLCDPAVLGEFHSVLHLGWSSVPLLSEQDPGIEEREDFPFLRGLVDAALQRDLPPQVVFFSTAAVYGNTDRKPATEETSCQPLGRYAAAKLAAEKIVAKLPGSCCLRVSNVFGSLSTEKPQGIIPLLYRACHTGETVTIWGDGTATKDYLQVDDLTDAVTAVLNRHLEGVFNVASGHSLSINEIIHLVEEVSRRPLRRTHVEAFPWDVHYSVLSPARIAVSGGWRATHNPVDHIRQMMAD